jgi:hypothetical protein
METYTDEVIDAIAAVEAQRQAMAHEAGVAAASSAALRQLHALLDRVRAALQSQDPDAGRLANVEAVTIEIERVKKLAGVTSPGPAFRNMQRDPRQVSLQSGRRIPPRNKGRRTMGRASGR